MRVFIDTEFTDFTDAELISFGAVADDGREFYAELTDFDRSRCSDFVRAIVLPKLGTIPAETGTRAAIGAALKRWLLDLGGDVEICFDYSGDWKFFYCLVADPETGALPKSVRGTNINAQISDLDLEQYWIDHGCNDHHALYDARANRYALEQHGKRSL